MGKEALDGYTQDLPYDDPRVCRDYLCGLCPHDLFTNTKADLGPCAKQHPIKAKEDYEKALTTGKLTSDFEYEHYRSLARFVDDCDKKIRASERRLERTIGFSNTSSALDREREPSINNNNTNVDPAIESKMVVVSGDIKSLNDTITQLTEEMETLGEQGQVSSALALFPKLEELHGKKQSKETELKVLQLQSSSSSSSSANSSSTSLLDTKQPAGSGHLTNQQKLRVCQICSAYLSIADSDRRLADHFAGKMHLGYKKVRDTVEELVRKFGRGGGGGNYGNGAAVGGMSMARGGYDRDSRDTRSWSAGGGGRDSRDSRDRGGWDRERRPPVPPPSASSYRNGGRDRSRSPPRRR